MGRKFGRGPEELTPVSRRPFHAAARETVQKHHCEWESTRRGGSLGVAVFKLASIFSQGTGKLGENVVSKGQEGCVGVRPRVIPANPQSPAQMKVRGAQTESSQAWETLSSLQCSGWRLFAAGLPQRSNKTGLPIKKQGFNAFCSLYDRFRLANPTGVFPKDAPVARFVAGPIAIQVDDTGAGTATLIASQASATGQTVEILAQRLAGKNRQPQPGAYRTKAYHVFAAGGLSFNVSLSAGYWAFAYRVVSTVNGMAGPLKPIGTALVGLSLVEGGADEKPSARKKAA